MTHKVQHLFDKGYVDLGFESYRRWMLKEWHEYFVKNKMVKLNGYGQWCVVDVHIAEVGKMLMLFDRYKDAKEKNKTLSPEDNNELVLKGLIKK